MTYPADLVNHLARAIHTAEFPSDYDDLPDDEQELNKHIANRALDAQQAWLARQPVALDEEWAADCPKCLGSGESDFATGEADEGPEGPCEWCDGHGDVIVCLAARPVVPDGFTATVAITDRYGATSSISSITGDRLIPAFAELVAAISAEGGDQ